MSEAAQRDVDAVLRRIPVPATYSANLFRITGLATDAGNTAVRRRREELAMAAKLGTALPSPWGALAPNPPPDADAIKDAFEALTAPLVRLVHEAFWLDGSGGAHDEAVAAHCRALDGGTDEDWTSALAHWANACESAEFWDRLERRAKDLDDPRVQGAHVHALRTSIPRRVLAANAHLAVHGVAADEAVVRRHLALLAASPFPRRSVAVALREACSPAVDRVHDLCSAVLRTAVEEPEQVLDVATRLLEHAPAGLAVPAAILPAEDPLPGALHDEVASAVVRAAVAHVNAGGHPADVTPLLERVRELAREHTTAALVERTATDLAEARVRAVVQPWLAAGDPNGAVEVLRRWRRRTDDDEVLRRMAADPRAVRAELSEVPSRSQFLGCGVRPFGRRLEIDETWIETRWITGFWVPLYPLASYLSDEDYVYAKVPSRRWEREWRQTAPFVLLGVVLALLFGWWAILAVAAGVGVVSGAAAVSRSRAMGSYLDEELGNSDGPSGKDDDE